MEDQLTVTPASGYEIDAYLRLRDSAAAGMIAAGIDQWRPGELTRDGLHEFGWDAGLHVARADGELVGGIIVVWRDLLFWGERDEPAGYIHGLLVDAAYRGAALGRRLLTWAEDHIAAHGRTLARLDTVTANGALRRYYRAAGYREVGERVFEDGVVHDDGAPIHACTLFEKQLEPPANRAPGKLSSPHRC